MGCLVLLLIADMALANEPESETAVDQGQCQVKLLVLGIGEDAGIPQLGNFREEMVCHIIRA